MTERTDKADATHVLRWIAWVAVALVLAFALVRAFRPAAVLVDVATVKRGLLRVTADDDGRTRVRERFTISAPIQGRLLRTPLRAGDAIRAGETVVAEFVPSAPSPLDVRTRLEATARTARAAAALEQAQARDAEARAQLEYARSTRERVATLHADGITSRDELERAQRDENAAFEGARAADRAVQVARYEQELAHAALVEDPAAGAELVMPREAPAEIELPDVVPEYVEPSQGRLLLRSPVDGTVLRVLEESDRTMTPGTPILEIGDVRDLEVVADYLSEEAVRIRPGMLVLVDGWSGDDDDEPALRATVRLVEPAGFTKVSALGVEEQRVNVIMDPAGGDGWAALGDGYRVELSVVLWQGDDVLIVPTGALFRDGETWSVFVVERGRARGRQVEVGHMGGLEAEALDGVSDGDVVVMYPSELIADGARVAVR